MDEAQNIPNYITAKGIMTRPGEGTQLVLAGDVTQSDSPFTSEWSNPLTWVSERMKGAVNCVQITFTEKETVRSPQVREAIERLGL